MAGSTLTGFNYIPENSEATPGLWNSVFSVLSQNLAEANSIGNLVSNVSTVGMVTINANSNVTDYLYFNDTSNQRSDYIIGSQVGGTADGLNIWDASGQTMIASFSKQSVRFYQNVVGPVFDIGGALASTYNAATYGTGADPVTTRIQAAISAASLAGVKRVYVPASMYPYNAALVSFDSRVQMVREGGNWSVYDVLAYGAYGDFAHDDDVAINAAISNASNAGGGVVYLPAGDYRLASSLVFSPTLTNTLYMVGSGRRDVVLRPTASVHTAIIIGATNAKTQYGHIADLTVTGIDTSNHTGCGLHLIQGTFWTFDRVNIEGFPLGTGAYLQGQLVSTGSEAVRNTFTQVVISTCQRPLYLRNVDENEFYSLVVGLQTGSASSVTAIEINQGRNNRFYGLLMQGETSSLTTGRPNYIGLYFSNPITAGGDNQGHSVYGAVAEGFEWPIYIPNSGISRLLLLQFNASICSRDLFDSGASTCVISPMAGRFSVPDGFASFPSPGYSSDVSLGFYHSGNSRIDVTGGTLYALAGSSTTPSWAFASARSTGLIDNAGPGLDVMVAGTVAGRALASQWATLPGSAVLPSHVFTSETSLGFYRSASSTMALSYGTLRANTLTAFVGGSAALPAISIFGQGEGLFDAGSNIMGISGGGVAVAYAYPSQFVFALGTTALLPVGFQSERSMGFYRSGVSTINVSYGTFNLATQAVRLSMRTLAASAVTTSAVNTNVAKDEVVFTIGGASGASLIISSGGTAYIFNSAASAILA